LIAAILEGVGMHVQEAYRGFVIAWHEPPIVGHGYQLNVGSEDPDLNGKLQYRDRVRPANPDLKAAKAEARRFLDGLLGNIAA
jgi:hypothetical protein